MIEPITAAPRGTPQAPLLLGMVRARDDSERDQDNYGDAIAQLRKNLLDKPRVRHVEADVNGGKRPVTRWEVPRFGELALRVWVRERHGGLT